ncbi:MAG: peptidoglycan-binding domain-containing protein [Candidatus Sungbacteria bacterium]|nr:peptidoglycan-binding domain-containing protein [Candidatus Sungbacteria bacterium]
MNSGQAVTFSWTLSNAGGYSFVIPCVSGVKLKKEDGSKLNCDVPISTTLATNDAIIVIAHNFSGSTKNITGRLTPKDTGGADYAAGAKEVSVFVATLAQPITSFTASAADTTSGQPVTISWTSDFLDGVNLQIECRSEITVSSPSYTSANVLPCGKIIFPSDLGASGSLSLLFTNSTNQPIPYTVKLYPAITSHTSYDGTHSVSLAFNVASDVLPDPVVNYFTASTTAVTSGDVVTLSWGTAHGAGVNIKFSCSSMITASSTKDITQFFPCDAYLFDPPLSPVSQTKISFNNSGAQDQNMIITLVPSKKGGTYDALRGKSIALTVRPLRALPVPSPSVIASPTPVAAATPSVSPFLSSPSKTIFTQMLKRGSRGQQVLALQEFLKLDPELYPEGLVTGYYGPATERAVKRFQKKYAIISSGTPAMTGYGNVGPRTREKLNSLQ